MVMWALILLGCVKDESPATEVPAVATDCDSLDENNCLFPFPSSRFLVEDAATPSGLRVNYAEDALPRNTAGTQLSPRFWNEKDGYSINSTLIFDFEDGSDAGLLPWTDVADHDGPNATTVVVNVDTGALIPHWSEKDTSTDNARESAYIIHPAVPLDYDTHYAVGVRGLTKNDGSPVDVSAGFMALRDGTDSGLADVEDRRQRFDDAVFPALETAGFARAELQLAWDFRTGTRENSLGRMLWMRDDALGGLPEGGPAYVVDNVEDHDCSTGGSIGRTVDLTVTAPLYMEAEGPDNILTRDDDGMPFRNGETTYGVVVRIPCSITTDPGPSRVVQYGHGLLGSRGEARTGWLSALANENRWVIVGADWTGMSEEDITAILNMSAGDPSRFAIVPERSMQGLVQQLMVVPLMRGDFMDDPAMQVEGVGVLDGENFGYYGNSQGGIMGGALMALSQDIERGVLGVTGANYGLLLTRSRDFDIYFLIFKQNFSDGRDIALLIQGLVQQVWDPAEAAGYFHAMNTDPLPNTPPKDILLHTAIGDAQVTTIAGQIQARAYGAKMVGTPYREVFGVDTETSGFTGSALVEWHYSDAPEEPLGNTPPTGGDDPHECPRREPASYAQVRDFLEDGVINDYCDGVCSSTVADVCPD